MKPTVGNPARARLGLALCALALLLAPWLVGQAGGNSAVRTLDFALLYLLLALGLNIVVGYAGLLDMGFIAFYALGAYLAAWLSSPHLLAQLPALAAWLPFGLHTPWWALLPLAALLAAGLGVLLGAPTLRLRGDYLAIVTLGFGEIIRILMRNLDRPVNLTNGSKGIGGIDSIGFFGVDLARTHELLGVRFTAVYSYYYLFAALALLLLLACVRLQDSRIGRAWMAIREDEDAAQAMGLDIRRLKLLAFALGAAFGGIGGALFASFQGFVSPESFTLSESVAVLAMVVLGGMGHLPGVVLGCLLLSALPEVLRASLGPLQLWLFGTVLLDAEVVRQLLYGLALILVMRYRPGGLWPAPREVRR